MYGAVVGQEVGQEVVDRGWVGGQGVALPGRATRAGPSCDAHPKRALDNRNNRRAPIMTPVKNPF